MPARALLWLMLARLCQAAFYYPDVQGSLLEHILVDNWGAYASNFTSAITPCTNYVTEIGEPALVSGRTTAAQWMRVAFHDFVTANVTAGTGGIDASIGFETLRSENSGSAMNDSFTFWRPFVNDAVSMADLVALGTVMAVNVCGGHKIPFQPGRVDAPAAGITTGVPAPETDLEETLVFFERAGFNQQDSIGLTACGHTIGSIHHGGFPDVVPESAVTPNNTNGGIEFDTTRGVFDTRVVHEYIDWTGHRGGALVTTDNITTRSDLRLYESDGNSTMRSLYDQGTGFLDTCVQLLGRMINTVPAGVALRGQINAMPVKPINVTYDFGGDGKVELSGSIRILTPHGGRPPASLRLSFPNGHFANLAAESDTGSSVFGGDASLSPPIYGTTTYFRFAVPSQDIGGSEWLKVDGSGIAPEAFPVQAGYFIVPSETGVYGTTVNVTVASKSRYSSGIAVTVAAPTGQTGTLGPKLIRSEVVVTKLSGLRDGYEILQGTVDLDAAVTGAIGIHLVSNGSVVDTLMLGAGVAGW